MMGGEGVDMMGGAGGGDMGDMTAQAPSVASDMMGGDDFGGMMGSGDMGSVDMTMPPPPLSSSNEPEAPPLAGNGNGNGAAVGPEAATFASAALAEWKANQQRNILEKEAEEVRELQTIREEAAAERELMYSQREKQLQAVHTSNRERQAATEQTTANQTGWEAVFNLLSDENLVPDKHTDLARFKQMLTRLKHQQPLTVM